MLAKMVYYISILSNSDLLLGDTITVNDSYYGLLRGIITKINKKSIAVTQSCGKIVKLIINPSFRYIIERGEDVIITDRRDITEYVEIGLSVQMSKSEIISEIDRVIGIKDRLLIDLKNTNDYLQGASSYPNMDVSSYVEYKNDITNKLNVVSGKLDMLNSIYTNGQLANANWYSYWTKNPSL